MKINGKLILVLLLLISAFIIRIYKIDKVPASLYIDEVDIGLQARSLLHNFKDYTNKFSPFYVHSFNDIRTPIPVYLTTISTLVFEKQELQIRSVSAVLGTVIVIFSFLITRFWTNQFWASFFVALVFATSPWQIQFSRISHEVISMMAFLLAALYFFFKALQNQKFVFLFLSTICLSLTVYTYRTMSLFAPLMFLLLSVIYFRQLLIFSYKKLLILIILAGALILPFLYATTIGAPDIPRIQQLAIFNDPEVPIWVQRDREIDSGDFQNNTIGKQASPLSFIFHSKPLSWLGFFSQNYFKVFYSEFLFLKGDPNPRHSIGKIGELFYIDILALLAGLFYLKQNIKLNQYKFLLGWLLFAPIPAALTVDGANHAARLFILSAPLLIIIGLGWWFLLIALIFYTVK